MTLTRVETTPPVRAGGERAQTRIVWIPTICMFALTLVLWSGCGGEQEPAAHVRLGPEPGRTVATYAGGTIAVADLVNHALEERSAAKNPLASILGGIRAPVVSQNMLTPAGPPDEETIQARRVEWVTSTIDTLALRREIAKKALENGLDQSDSYKTSKQDWLQLLLARRVQYERILKDIHVSSDDIEDYYTDNPSEFTKPARVKVRGIYAYKQGGPNNRQDWREARDRIEEARRKILAGADFVAVAKEVSEAMPHLRGMDQDEYPVTDLPKAMVDAVMGAGEGKVTDLVELETSSGEIYIIYEAVSITPEEKIAFDESMKTRILQKLYDQRYQLLERNLFRTLMLQHDPEYHPEWLKEPPEDMSQDILSVGNLYSKSFADFYRQSERIGHHALANKQAYLDILAGRALAYAEALAQGWSEEHVAARLKPHQDSILANTYLLALADEEELSDEAFLAYYEENRQIFRTDRRMDVYYIFIPAKVTSGMEKLLIHNAVSRAVGIATFVLGEARSGQPFELLASEYSKDPLTAGNNGYLGRVTLQDIRQLYGTHDQYTQVLPKMESGQISDALYVANHTTGRFGAEIYHIAETEEPRAMTFQEAVPRIGKILGDRFMAEKKKELFDSLRGELDIQIDLDTALATLAALEECATDPVKAIGLWEYANPVGEDAVPDQPL